MRTTLSKNKASDPELKEYASMLRKACEDLKLEQARSLEYAVYAGKVVRRNQGTLEDQHNATYLQEVLRGLLPPVEAEVSKHVSASIHAGEQE